jgi:hypothetical protein
MLTYMYFGTNDLERAIAFYNGRREPRVLDRQTVRRTARDSCNGSMAAFRAWSKWTTSTRQRSLTLGSPTALRACGRIYNPDFYAAYVRPRR